MVVLILATLTSYRFGLLAYSKLFPKPRIPIDNHTRLTPVHYLCIFSMLLEAIPIWASCLLISKEYPLTNPFMMGIDIMVVTVLNIIFSIWFVSVTKPQEYYDEGTKKYTLEENIFRTEETFN